MADTQETLVMGILNVTPDSFADGGRHFSLTDAVARAEAMVAEGVNIIDVGGESTRPGSSRISADEESARVIPVIEAIKELGATISIDTTRSEIAKEAIAKGASIVNDLSGGLQDSAMVKVLSSHPEVREVREELEARAFALVEAGISPDQLILDPGIGFAKTSEHNWELLRNIDRIQLLGYPVLVGVSRKRFLGELLGGAEPDQRDDASVAITTELARKGIWGVRTHSVKPHVDAIKVVKELYR